MASIIPGYNYDIFISYRQKDNKGDKWVSQFVEALKDELESTFKEEVSVYFDINPSDYLLESYDVNASLKAKLKCLVFIPILSRTYCDSKSFAWVHEFKAFVEDASKDQHGLKVKLPNGNVASRVLPVIIHDLDPSDKKECESTLGGVLRGIEFVYKEAGIDKPLSPGDNEKKNLNNTTYRIQIIKVAHAIKEIVLGMKSEPAKVVLEKDQPLESVRETSEDNTGVESGKPARGNRIKFLSTIAVIALLIIAGIFIYPKIFKEDSIEKLRASGERISIVVMPFQNMTNDTTNNFCQEMIQDVIINSLSNSENLKIIQLESIQDFLQNKDFANYTSLTSFASNISQKLDANIFICGSIKEIDNYLRLNAQIVDSKSKEVNRSFQIDGLPERIILLADSISSMIRDFLMIAELKKENIEQQALTNTHSPEAYRYFILGKNAFDRGDIILAIKWLDKSLEIDSNFVWAMRWLCSSYQNLGNYYEAKKWSLKFLKETDIMAPNVRLWASFQYALLFQTPNEAKNYMLQLRDIDSQFPPIYFSLGWCYYLLQQYDKAIPEFEKVLEIYKKWGLKPSRTGYYHVLGRAYFFAGQHKKAKKIFKRGLENNPSIAINYYRWLAINALITKESDEANNYLEEYISIRKEEGASEATIASDYGYIYSLANLLDKAEEYYQKAISLEPNNDAWKFSLATFLIDKDRNLNQGLELMEQLNKLYSGYYNVLDWLGWGLYKQDKYQEALEILQKSWDLRREQAVYDHTAYLHLEAAKKAVAGQKSN